jgi:hypothetical protein
MRRILMIAALISALGAIRMAANPKVRRPVQHFIHLYRQQDSELGIWPRAVSSWLLAKNEE